MPGWSRNHCWTFALLAVSHRTIFNPDSQRDALATHLLSGEMATALISSLWPKLKSIEMEIVNPPRVQQERCLGITCVRNHFECTTLE